MVADDEGHCVGVISLSDVAQADSRRRAGLLVLTAGAYGCRTAAGRPVVDAPLPETVAPSVIPDRVIDEPGRGPVVRPQTE